MNGQQERWPRAAMSGWQYRERGNMEDRLKRASEYCSEITRQYSRSFYFSSGLLPAEKRRAVRVLYAFCRLSDNIVDNGGPDSPAERLAQLESWRLRMHFPSEEQDHPVLLAWANVRRQYGIPVRYAEDLLDGMRMDLSQFRYETFSQLWRYCYCVAATVGLCSMHIVGFVDRSETFQKAEGLGVALQLTNILRDVGEDWRRGRVYLPQEDLDRFGYTEADLSRGLIDERYRALMDFEIQRANRLYAQAWAGIALLNEDGRLAIAVAAEVYRSILDKLVAWQYDNFRRRAYLSTWEKLRVLLRVWWRVRSLSRCACP